MPIRLSPAADGMVAAAVNTATSGWLVAKSIIPSATLSIGFAGADMAGASMFETV